MSIENRSKRVIRTPYVVSPTVVSQAKSTMYLTFYAGYCTNFAARAYFAQPKIGVAANTWRGDAKLWLGNAKAAGWATTTDALGGEVGSIVVWGGGKYGHVGVITDFSIGDGGVVNYVIAEMNYGKITDAAVGKTTNFGKVSSRTLQSSMLSSAGLIFSGFVLPRRA